MSILAVLVAFSALALYGVRLGTHWRDATWLEAFARMAVLGVLASLFVAFYSIAAENLPIDWRRVLVLAALLVVAVTNLALVLRDRTDS